MSKIILDLCGGTGAWSKPYKDAGYEVKVITMPAFDVCETDLSEYGISFYDHGDPPNLKVRWHVGINPKNVYGILAAPPCTMFSIARRTAKTPPDFYRAMLVVRACMEIIWFTRTNNDNLRFWVMENPTGLLRQFIGKPPYNFYQWQFGEPLTKRTDLWGYFNPPRPTVKEKPTHDLDKEWANPNKTNEYKHLNRTERRAITPAGFAQAFFEANK